MTTATAGTTTAPPTPASPSTSEAVISMNRTAEAIRDLVAALTANQQSGAQGSNVTSVAPSPRPTKWNERLMGFQQKMLLRASADVITNPKEVSPATEPVEFFRLFLEAPKAHSLWTLVYHLHTVFKILIVVDRNLMSILQGLHLTTHPGAEHPCRLSLFFMGSVNAAKVTANALSDVEFTIRAKPVCMRSPCCTDL